MAIEQLPIFCYYDVQRFTQFGSMSCSNWYGISVDSAKKKQALYPAMGRKHIRTFGLNRLIYNSEPRAEYRTIDYLYTIVSAQVYQYDKFFNEKPLSPLIALTGNIWFTILAVDNVMYALLSDETNLYLITENGTSVTMELVTDVNAPGGATSGGSPQYVATFGNRFVVSYKDTPNYGISTVNATGGAATMFTVSGAALVGRATGVIRQFAVLHAQLYIFTDFTTNILANIQTEIVVGAAVRVFPFKVNTSYNWDYGMADPFSLAVGFGRIVWLAQNEEGLVSFMSSDGQQPKDISSQAINVLLENESAEELSPFIKFTSHGFIYQYENTVFYRVSAGIYTGTGLLDIVETANSIEYNYETGTWARCIELNGERNRIERHVYFSNRHIVSVQGDFALYEMSGNFYVNELRTPDTDAQAADAFTTYPFRYELVTKQLYLEDYAEFIDDYVQIDFVFGDRAFFKSDAPFANTVYIVDEDGNFIIDEGGAFLIEEGTNYPTIYDDHWNVLFKPHIELYISDDGGVTFVSADVREPWQLGQYQWIMRWNELGTSRNRCYKLICVSPAPIVILGAVRNTRRASGGAN